MNEVDLNDACFIIYRIFFGTTWLLNAILGYLKLSISTVFAQFSHLNS